MPNGDPLRENCDSSGPGRVPDQAERLVAADQHCLVLERRQPLRPACGEAQRRRA